MFIMSANNSQEPSMSPVPRIIFETADRDSPSRSLLGDGRELYHEHDHEHHHRRQQQEEDEEAQAQAQEQEQEQDLANDLPQYSRLQDPNAPRLPSYARATRPPEMTPAERLASLHEFIESKMYVDDTFGGLKGTYVGPPTNPLKPFQWLRRKAKGEKHVWRKITEEDRQKWETEEGEITESMDTNRII